MANKNERVVLGRWAEAKKVNPGSAKKWAQTDRLKTARKEIGGAWSVLMSEPVPKPLKRGRKKEG